MTEHQIDGRRLRGQQRLQQILDAAVELIHESGTAHLSHRALATQAGVSLATINYHFPTRDELIHRAYAQVVNDELTTARGAIDQLRQGLCAQTPPRPEQLASRILSILAQGLPRQPALYDLYLDAARNPELTPLARQWSAGLIQAATPLFADLAIARPEEAATLLCHTADGILLTLLADPTPQSHASNHRTLSRLLALLIRK